jgi:hypothetical protein
MAAAAVWITLIFAAQADYRTDVGYDALQAELGAGLPTGAGVGISQIEAGEAGTGYYRPDAAHPEFVGKAINFLSGSPTGASGHATTVGAYFYGVNSSLAPGVAAIDVYEIGSWVDGFLKLGSLSMPAVESRAVSNHSWIGTSGSGTDDQEILRRFDFAIQRDDFLAVVALNNGSGNPVPPLLGSSYNGLVVGLSSGDHSTGTSSADGAGRVKPDIVSPFGLTSYAAPAVGAAAALLLEKAGAVGSLADATRSVVLKAILLAGATKNEFPSWDRTTTRPLDEHYGAGQLNVYRSYHVLTVGPQAASASVSVRPRGWDFRAASSGSRFYFFDVAAGNTASGFSAALTWNRVIADGPGFGWGNPTSTLANLTLKLHTATGFTVGTLVDSSASTVDNVEHIYAPALAPGRYALEVTSDTTGVDYGFAWFSLPTVTIAATTPSAAEEGALPGTFTITRAGETVEALTVNLAIGGSALNGTDYTTIPASVTIPVGASSATVTIAPITDAQAEGDETVTLTLANHLAYAIGGASTATVTMADRPFDAWRFSEFTTLELSDPQVSGAEADPDQDGLENLEEYAFQLPPKISSVAGLPVAGRDLNGALTLSYTLLKSATDITSVPEISTDLGMWNSGAGYVTVQSTDQGLTWSVVATSLLSPVAEPRQFLRVRITRP